MLEEAVAAVPARAGDRPAHAGGAAQPGDRLLQHRLLSGRLHRRAARRAAAPSRRTADARRRLARAYLGTGDHAGARRELHRLLAADPVGPADAGGARPRGEGGRASSTRRSSGCAARWSWSPRAPSSTSTSASSTTTAGSARRRTSSCSAPSTSSPDFADAHYLLAFVLGDLGQAEAAASAARRARELNPSLARAETNLSLDRYNSERYGELVGDRSADAAHRARPSSYLARYHVGIAFREKGLYPEALRELEHALEAGEDPALVRQAIAEVTLLSGESAEAVQAYESLLEEQADSPKLWNELGVCRHQQGDMPGAEECYRGALKNDDELRAGLEQPGGGAPPPGRRGGGGREPAARRQAAPGLRRRLVQPGAVGGAGGAPRGRGARLPRRPGARPARRGGLGGPGPGGMEGGRVAEARSAFARALDDDARLRGGPLQPGLRPLPPRRVRRRAAGDQARAGAQPLLPGRRASAWRSTSSSSTRRCWPRSSTRAPACPRGPRWAPSASSRASWRAPSTRCSLPRRRPGPRSRSPPPRPSPTPTGWRATSWTRASSRARSPRCGAWNAPGARPGGGRAAQRGGLPAPVAGGRGAGALDAALSALGDGPWSRARERA